MLNVNYPILSEQVHHYAQSIFKANAGSRFVYHDISHTQTMAAAAEQIAAHYQLNEHDYFIIYTASWFHDLGYFSGSSNHEEKGAAMAELFLKENGVDKETIDAIRNCILATMLPQTPLNLLEQIVCDADLFHLGTGDFDERNKLMRKEAIKIKETAISKDAWRNSTITFLEKHSYHTDYVKELLALGKQENLNRLKAKQAAHLLSSPEITSPTPAFTTGNVHTPVPEKQSIPEKKEKIKSNKPVRGVETVFRITSSNNQRLSSQADSKAHIMIQVNSIIISVLLSVLLRKIEDYPHLIIPAVMLLTVNLVTIIFSILATRPHIPRGTFSEKDIDEKKVNLLFFGNFYRMPLDAYTNGMLKMMDDHDFLYGSLIRDVYFQGVVLGRKYKWLRLSYNVFMFGLVASVLTFVIAAIAYKVK